jgi:hypothetical protein
VQGLGLAHRYRVVEPGSDFGLFCIPDLYTDGLPRPPAFSPMESSPPPPLPHLASHDLGD